MIHSRYKSMDVRTGQIEIKPFAYIDGVRFGYTELLFKTSGGFDGETALLVTNRWNYLASIQPYPTVSRVYFVHSVEGAS